MEIATKEDFDRMEGRVEYLTTLFDVLLEKIGEPILDISAISKRTGCSKSVLYRELWRLPNFGLSDFSTGTRRWYLKTYLKWIEVSEDERKRQWDLMPRKEREKISLRG